MGLEVGIPGSVASREQPKPQEWVRQLRRCRVRREGQAKGPGEHWRPIREGRAGQKRGILGNRGGMEAKN